MICISWIGTSAFFASATSSTTFASCKRHNVQFLLGGMMAKIQKALTGKLETIRGPMYKYNDIIYIYIIIIVIIRVYIYVEGTFTYRMTGFENFYILTCDMCMLWSTGLAQFSTTTKAFPKFKRCLPTSEAGCIRTHLQVFNGAQCTCSLSFIALISVPWSALCTFLNFVMQRCLPTSEQGLYQNPPTSPEWCALHAHKPLGWCLGLHLALS